MIDPNGDDATQQGLVFQVGRRVCCSGS
eukprot:COSAG06_NODE_54116_length_296_cov_0.791878_1_plen_27_part_10